ncbi:predicted protein [Nematostella vectensis]|uniref:tRNA (adenine(58)-N(1))-methyltransferase catalytic subunit TRMT61A n=1 Tax=Nematostella vectensis TaxID=45351 RepID=A7RHG9_NEMVE|nr:predicted protein [Nematostella vectensis]|eukprot:XP_001640910.1 predicted protein [Nematostella vectensis]
MSFLKYNSTICEGDTVILYLGHNNMHSIVVTAGKVHQTKFGAFPHSDMVGKQFGSKVCKKGYLFLLHPTPELWTINLPHRTQILYSTDISMVLMQLDIKPGSVVMESGTGSASMSHALIRSIAPTGHLYTYEFHEERSKQARKEFIDHNVDHLVTVTHRNVTADGFLEENIADAVFLDLPSPWDAIKFSKKALKREGGRLCSFSPCIEQVQKTCGVMRDNGFRDIQVMECLLKTFDVKTVSYQMPDFGEKVRFLSTTFR